MTPPGKVLHAFLMMASLRGAHDMYVLSAGPACMPMTLSALPAGYAGAGGVCVRWLAWVLAGQHRVRNSARTFAEQGSGGRCVKDSYMTAEAPAFPQTSKYASCKAQQTAHTRTYTHTQATVHLMLMWPGNLQCM